MVSAVKVAQSRLDPRETRRVDRPVTRTHGSLRAITDFASVIELQRTAGNKAVTALLDHRVTGRNTQAGSRALSRPMIPLAPQAPRRAPLIVQRNGDYSHLSVFNLGAALKDTGEHDEGDQTPDSFDGRLAALADFVAQAAERMKKEQTGEKDEPTRVLGVITAPEWFFKRPLKPFSKSEKSTLQKYVKNLSNSYRELLIIPGSIVWEDGKAIRNTTFAYLNNKLLRELDKQSDGGDVVGFYPTSGESKKKKQSKAEGRYQKGFGRKIEAGGNVPGGSSFFQAGNIRFSLEICKDHIEGRAKQEQTLNSSAPKSGVDVQILISHGSNIRQPSDVTRPGGIIVRNDAQTGGVTREIRRNLGEVVQGGSGAQINAREVLSSVKDASGERGGLTIQLPASSPRQRGKHATILVSAILSDCVSLRNGWSEWVDQLAEGKRQLANLYNKRMVTQDVVGLNQVADEIRQKEQYVAHMTPLGLKARELLPWITHKCSSLTTALEQDDPLTVFKFAMPELDDLIESFRTLPWDFQTGWPATFDARKMTLVALFEEGIEGEEDAGQGSDDGKGKDKLHKKDKKEKKGKKKDKS